MFLSKILSTVYPCIIKNIVQLKGIYMKANWYTSSSCIISYFFYYFLFCFEHECPTGECHRDCYLILISFVYQAHQIANLIREYMEVLQSPPEIPRRDSTMAQQLAQQQQQQQQQQQHSQPPATTVLPTSAGGRKSRPASAMLHRGAPVIQSQAS